MSKTQSLKKLFLIPVLCAASACSAAGDGPAADSGAVAEEGSAITVHEENLIDGAKLKVLSINGELAIQVTAPSTMSEAFTARVKASAEASDFEARYVAWTGGSALPAKLQELLAAAPKGASLAVSANEERHDEQSTKANSSASSTDAGGGLGKTQQAATDWTADGQRFLDESCATNSKQHTLHPQTNISGGHISWLTRYHRMAQRAAEGNSQFRITIDGNVAFSGAVAAGTTSFWDFGTDETPHDVFFEGWGNRLHQCMLGGWEKASKIKVTSYQTPDLDIEVTGIAFKPGSAVALYFVHPNEGNFLISSGFKVRSTSSVVATTAPFPIRCEQFRITRRSKYAISTILMRGSDGREATITTDQIQNKCWDVLPRL